jgi:4-diphosphocytidyl-2C-methyl-D-erythritol kinase
VPRDWPALAAHARNDFEPVVGARHPEIALHVAALQRAGAVLAMMSGSGSTVFGVFDAADVPAARDALQGLPGAPLVVWTRTARRVVPVALLG